MKDSVQRLFGEGYRFVPMFGSAKRVCTYTQYAVERDDVWECRVSIQPNHFFQNVLCIINLVLER